MRTFLSYLYLRRRVIAAFALFSGVFAAVFALYSLPMRAVGYGAAICLAAALCFGARDCYCFIRRHKALLSLKDEITVSLDNLPEPRGAIEKDYTELIGLLFNSGRRLENTALEKAAGMTDYYTAWAHQIKTPIAAMRLTLQSMPESDDVFLMSDDLQRIEQYTDMVLCYVRLDSDSTDYVIRRYPLDDIVRQAVKKFSSQFIRKKIRLEYEPLGASVLTDEKWLLFVVEQVISNALKYTRRGAVSIYLDKGALCVRDTGCGIAPEDLPRVFDKGFTGCNGRADKRASGIGLYLCRRICAALGHTISADSRLPENGEGGFTEIRIGLERAKLDTRD